MLILPDKKALVVRPRNPQQLLTLIPTAKPLTVQGKEFVAVPHRLEETRVLRNLGMRPPSPIKYHYDWSGTYKPFKAQGETAEFLTLNPRAYVLNGMGCIAGDDRVRVSRKGKSYETSLRELFAAYTKSDKVGWKARSLKGDVFGMHKLLDVLYKGEKPTLRITLEDGKTFRATPDHRIARPDGSWTEAGDLRVGDDLVTNGVVSLACPACGTPRDVSQEYAKRAADKVCKTCKGAAHSARMTGDGNPAFKGKPFKDKDGYIRVWKPDHHRADNSGRVYEHILVAEEAFGVVVTRDYHVHHKNGIKDDNRPANLEVLLGSDHHRSHKPYAKLDGAVSGNGGVVVVVPKAARISSIEDGGVVDVYDLCMEAPHHNFVVNGVVVHNSGKTMATLWAYDYLRTKGFVHKMLVVCPLSTMERTWADEIFKHFPHLDYRVLYGNRAKRFKLLDMHADIYIVNHDGLKIIADGLKGRQDIDIVVVDEVAQAARNASTDRWKVLNQIVNKQFEGTRWCWGLTGTPTPNAPTDAWAQCRLITPTSVPPYFNRFKDQVMKQVNNFLWVPRPDAMETVHRVMQPSIRFSREECVDLPPCLFQTRHVPLTPSQQTAYKQMLSQLRVASANGEILAVNEAVKAAKLVQIACLAGDTEVLTSSGWKRIDRVTRADRVWDGEEWVSHRGVVHNGRRSTITRNGVVLTPDHLVLTETAGWVEAKEVMDGDASEGFVRQKVRLPDRDSASWFDGRHHEVRDMAMSLRLRKHRGSGESEPAENHATERAALRVPARSVEQNARQHEPPALPHVDRNAAAVREPGQQGLGAIRWARHNCMRALGVVRSVLGGHGTHAPTADNPGSSGQQWPVRARELQVGHRVGASGKQEAEVYDITDCGPRNRFVVRGTCGELSIVHNCGVAYDTDGNEVTIGAQSRLEVVEEIVEQADAKVIVFVPFVSSVHYVADHLRSKGYSVECIYGEVSKTERDRIFGEFQNCSDPKVIVAQPAAMSHGLTLVAANTMIWYAPIFSNDTFDQACARITRPGQTRNQLIVKIEGSPIELKAYDRLQNKQKMQGILLSMVEDDRADTSMHKDLTAV